MGEIEGVVVAVVGTGVTLVGINDGDNVGGCDVGSDCVGFGAGVGFRDGSAVVGETCVVGGDVGSGVGLTVVGVICLIGGMVGSV